MPYVIHQVLYTMPCTLLLSSGSLYYASCFISSIRHLTSCLMLYFIHQILYTMQCVLLLSSGSLYHALRYYLHIRHSISYIMLCLIYQAYKALSLIYFNYQNHMMPYAFSHKHVLFAPNRIRFNTLQFINSLYHQVQYSSCSKWIIYTNNYISIYGY